MSSLPRWMVMILFASPLLAGEHPLQVRVVDPSGAAVPDASVRCAGARRAAHTGAFGTASIDRASLCLLQTEHAGFERSEIEVSGTAAAIKVVLKLPIRRESVTVRGEPERGLFDAVQIDRDEIQRWTGSLDDLLVVTKLRTGLSLRADVFSMDGLPMQSPPPLSTIERVSIHQDSFSAEFDDPGVTYIDIVTRAPARQFRAGFSGSPTSMGTAAQTNQAAAQTSNSGGGYVSGFVPSLPVYFTARMNLSTNREQLPLTAALPPDLEAGTRVGIFKKSLSRSLDATYFAAHAPRVRFGYSASTFDGVNLGAGELNLAETGVRAHSRTQEFRLSATQGWGWATYEGGGLLGYWTNRAIANSTAPGITVPGLFASGGAPLERSESSRTQWLWRSVLRSPRRRTWNAGAVLRGASDRLDQIPNSGGSLVFSSLEDYQRARAGLGTGVWFVSRGDGLAKASAMTMSAFGERIFSPSDRWTIVSGLRTDYQMGFGSAASPRLSVATNQGGFVIRASAGRFMQTISSAFLAGIVERDDSHLAQFTAGAVSFDTGAASAVLNSIRTLMVSGFTRPVQTAFRTSVERKMWGVLPMVEYTAASAHHLAGARRVFVTDRWTDFVESNRNLESQRLRARLSTEWRKQLFAIDYEWIHSLDDGPGLSPLPAHPEDLRLEWARTAGISPHSLSVSGVLHLPKGTMLIASESWRSGEPYNVTTGLDPDSSGAFADRGGRPRNSGIGPTHRGLGFHASRRVPIPMRRGTYVDVRLQGDNLLGNKNALAVGSIVGSPSFGRPLALEPGRTIRVSFGFN